MATVDQLQVQITANAANFNKELNSVKKQLSSVSGSSSKLTGGMIAGFSAVGVVIGNVMTAALRSVASHVDDAITRLDTLNNFPKVMSNLGISTEAAQKSIDVLSTKLEGLPTTLDEAALSVQRFTSANGNIEASTEMFLALNNAILAGGASTEVQSTALEQLSQAYAKGKPDMMEWRSMMTAMPAQLKQIATAMGYADASALGEALRGGTVSMNDFMATIVKLNKQGLDGFQSLEDQARNATGGVATAMTNLKNAITRGLTAIMDAIGQSNIAGFLNNVKNAILTAGNYVAAFVKVVLTAINALSALFGGKGITKTAQATESTASAMGGVASNADDATSAIDGTTGAAKKLAKQLAGFDEMNVLKEQDSSSGGGSGSGGSAGTADLSGMTFDADIFGETENAVDRIYNKIMETFGKLDLSKWAKALQNFKTGAVKAFTIIGNAGKSAWDKMFVPLAKHLAENTLPTFINDVGLALQRLDVTSWSNGFDTLFTGIGDALRPLADAVGTATGFIAELTTWLADITVPPALSIIGAAFSALGELLGGIVDGFRTVWEGVIQPWFDSVSEFLAPFIADIQSVSKALQENEALMNALKVAGQVLGATLGLVFQGVIEVVSGLIAALVIAVDFVLNLPTYIIQFFEEMWNIVQTVFKAIGDFCGSIMEGIGSVVNSVVTAIGNFFNGAWETIKTGARNAWEGIKSVFSTVASFFGSIFSNAWNAVKAVFSTGGRIFDGIKDGIVSAFKNIVNAIIGGINKVVAIPFNAINGVLNSIRSIDIMGIKPFEWIGTISVPQIPMLATGGITTGATLAMIGENGREAVLPLENNTGWMDELAEKISGNSGQPITIKIGEETILDTIITGINDASFLRNGSVIRI